MEYHMSVEENRNTVRRAYEEAWNKRNVAALDELIASNYVVYLAGRLQSGRGSEIMKQSAAMLHSAFPDLHHTVDDMIAEGEGRGTMDDARHA